MDGSGFKEQPQKSTLFPIAEQARRVGLDEIGSNAASVFANETQVITRDNINLAEYIAFIGENKKLVSQKQEYLEGAIFSHRIIREHATLMGTKVPIVSRAEIATYGTDMLKALHSGKQFENINKERHNALILEDPELGKALAEMVKYRASSADFTFGFIDMVTLLRRSSESEKLERTFNRDTDDGAAK